LHRCVDEARHYEARSFSSMEMGKTDGAGYLMPYQSRGVQQVETYEAVVESHIELIS